MKLFFGPLGLFERNWVERLGSEVQPAHSRAVSGRTDAISTHDVCRRPGRAGAAGAGAAAHRGSFGWDVAQVARMSPTAQTTAGRLCRPDELALFGRLER
jgi:hypothetical protein